MIEMTCIHCGTTLNGRYFLNAWLSGYECRPICEQGAAWYAVATWRTAAGVDVTPEVKEMTVEQRRVLCQTPLA